MRTLVATLAFAVPATAQVVVKDHVSDPALWDEVGIAPNFAANTSVFQTVLSGCTGNGSTVTKVGMIVANNLNGLPNPHQWWLDFDYDVRFFADVAAFQSNPLGPAHEVTFATPTNAGYATPVGTWTTLGGTFQLHYFEFDVFSAGITTTPGAQHLLAIVPRVAISQSTTGATGIAYSIGGTSAVGLELDYFYSNFGGTPLSNYLGAFGWAVHPYAAYKIELAQPATTQNIPTSCIGPVGAMSMTSNLPTLGTTFQSNATGFGTTSFAISVLGYNQTALPLAAVLPIGIAGCELLAGPDSVEVSLPVAGTASYQLAIPATNALSGLLLYHQFLQLELDPLGAMVSLSGSNGLALTVGF